jgi:AcrR family transcriptional regulator
MGAANQSVRGRGRPRSQESEKAILDATMELLSQLGFRAVTVDAIAERAGASKSTIYRRWPAKENLVIAAFANTPLLVTRGRGDTVSQLVEVQAQFARFMQETTLGGVLAALVAERAHNSALGVAMDPLVHQRRQPMAEILGRAIARGELPEDLDIELAIDMISAPVLQRIMVMGLPTERGYIRQVVETAIRGLGGSVRGTTVMKPRRKAPAKARTKAPGKAPASTKKK